MEKYQKIATKRIIAVVPTYNSWETLKDCIKSLRDQTFRFSQIVVVDNASTDGTAKNVSTFFPFVKLLKQKSNTGVCGGRNTGIRYASKSDYVLLFDHDMVADKRMLAELLEIAESDQAIGIVTPKIYYWEDKKRIWSAGTGVNLIFGQTLFRGGRDVGQYNKIEEVQVAPAAMLVKSEVFVKAGIFDEKYFATYEDTDFCFRAKRFGFKTYYTYTAIAFHKLPTDTGEEALRLLTRSYWVGRNRIIFLKRYGSPISLFVAPLFSLYYFQLALKYRRYKSFIEYLKGVIAGYLC